MTDGRDLRFKGELLASTSTSWNDAHPDYSGSVGRQAQRRIYRTTGGNLVAEIINESQWQGEHTIYQGKLCKTVDELCEFFGGGRQAKRIIAEAQLEHLEDVA